MTFNVLIPTHDIRLIVKISGDDIIDTAQIFFWAIIIIGHINMKKQIGLDFQNSAYGKKQGKLYKLILKL